MSKGCAKQRLNEILLYNLLNFQIYLILPLSLLTKIIPEAYLEVDTKYPGVVGKLGRK
jgi:hypothetical protein